MTEQVKQSAPEALLKRPLPPFCLPAEPKHGLQGPFRRSRAIWVISAKSGRERPIAEAHQSGRGLAAARRYSRDNLPPHRVMKAQAPGASQVAPSSRTGSNRPPRREPVRGRGQGGSRGFYTRMTETPLLLV